MTPPVTQGPSPEEWERQKSIITAFYLNEETRLQDLMTHMEVQNNFTATKNQYERKFREWNLKKKFTREEWKYVLQKKRKQELDGKLSEVTVFGIVWPEKKIRKGESRFTISELSNVDRAVHRINPPPPEGISVHTPLSQKGIRPALNSSLCTTRHPSRVGTVESKSPDILFRRQQISESSNVASSSNPMAQGFTASEALWLKKPGKLPYFELLDLVDSLFIGDNPAQLFPLEVSDFAWDIDISPHPPLLRGYLEESYEFGPTAYLTPGDFLLPDTQMLSSSIFDTKLFDMHLQHSSSFRNNSLVRPLASLLLPKHEDYKNGDALDDLKKREQELVTVLANMPERTKGEKETLMLTLLEPPHPTSAIFLLTTVIYLHSNQQRVLTSRALNWIVDNVSFESMRRLLLTGLPTLEAFKYDLLEYGVNSGKLKLVKYLLNTDNKLREFVCHSPHQFLEGTNDTEIVKCLLSTGIDVPGKDQELPFLTYCQTVEIGKLLLQAGANASSMDNEPLQRAIGYHRFDLIILLIKAGADVNALTYRGMSALRLAANFNRPDVLVEILENKASIAQVSEIGQPVYNLPYAPPILHNYATFKGTALQVAASAGHTEVVRILIDKGANINEPAHGESGETALLAATKGGHVCTVKLLLLRGASADAPGTSWKCSYTALVAAVERCNLPLVKLLLKFKANPNVSALGYHTVLEAARARQYTYIGQSLVAASAREKIEFGINDDKNHYIRIQLLHAIQLGDITRVKHLIACGAVVDMQLINEDDWHSLPSDCVNNHRPSRWEWLRRIPQRATMLHLAITSDSIVNCEMIKLLHTFVIDFNFESSKLEPLLHTAVRWKKGLIVDYLLDAGVDVDRVTSGVITWHQDLRYVNLPEPPMGHAALHVAASHGNIIMTKALISRGADINLATQDGPTPLQAALKCCRDIHGHEVLENEREMCHGGGNYDIAMILLGQGANVNCPVNWKFGNTALALASESRVYAIDVVLSLLAKGARVNYRPSVKVNTALQAAVYRGDLQLVQLLLDHGAEVNAAASTYSFFPGTSGTALQIASANGFIKVAQLLLKRGADINMAGVRSTSALTTAAEFCRLDIVQLLINAGADQHLPLNEKYSLALDAAQHPVLDSPNFGVIKLIQRYRNEALKKWNSLRILEMEQEENEDVKHRKQNDQETQ